MSRGALARTTPAPDRVRPARGQELATGIADIYMEAVRLYLRLRVRLTLWVTLTAGLQSLPATVQSVLLLLVQRRLQFSESVPDTSERRGVPALGKSGGLPMAALLPAEPTGLMLSDK